MTEVREKLNVWIAYLNLENMYGTKVSSVAFYFGVKLFLILVSRILSKRCSKKPSNATTTTPFMSRRWKCWQKPTNLRNSKKKWRSSRRNSNTILKPGSSWPSCFTKWKSSKKRGKSNRLRSVASKIKSNVSCLQIWEKCDFWIGFVLEMDMLVQFAILEFNLGEVEQGEVLFETILTSYVKRVDVWCTYVDQLVKKGNIDSAR